MATSSANVTIRSTREIASSSGADISAFFESVVEPQVTLVDTSHFPSWAAAALILGGTDRPTAAARMGSEMAASQGMRPSVWASTV